MQEVQFIDQPAVLAQACQHWASKPWLALDTEFIREKTYYPQLCLVQIGDIDQAICIDTLAIKDLSPLWELLGQTHILKVLHSASQDLEIFWHQTGQLPSPLFDTQIAASLMGLGDQISYAKLVDSLLSVQLDKSHTRTDWAKRPLDHGQLRYAADDVIYLARAYERLHDQLARAGRLDWLHEDFIALANGKNYSPAPETVWQRLKNLSQLKSRRELAIAQTLSAWRENTAMRANRPRRWILADEIIIDCARRPPKNSEALAQIRGLKPEQVERHGTAILAAIREGQAMPEEARPSLPERRHLTPTQESKVDVAMALLRHQAEHHGISTAGIASRKDVEQWVLGDPQSRLARGWRHALAGRTIEQWLNGETSVRSSPTGLLVS